MKKNLMRWTYPLGVKMLLALLCAVSLITLTVSSAGTILCHSLPDYKDELDAKYENVAMNYSAYALSLINSGWSAENVQEELEKTAPNFKYAIVASDLTASDLAASDLAAADAENLDDVDLSDPSVWLTGSPADQNNYRWTFEGTSDQSFCYFLENVLTTGLNSNYAYGYTEEAAQKEETYEVQNILYDQSSGLFYLETEAGLYPVQQVNLSVKMAITDRILQSLKDQGIVTTEVENTAGQTADEQTTSAGSTESEKADDQTITAVDTVAGEVIIAEDDEALLLEQQLLTVFDGVSSDKTADGNVIYGFMTITGQMNDSETGYDYSRSDEQSGILITPDGWDFGAIALQDWESVSMVDADYHVSQMLSREEDDRITEKSMNAAGSILSGSYAIWEDDADMNSIVLQLAETDPVHYWVLSWQADPLDESAGDLFAQWNQMLSMVYKFRGICLPLQIISFILLVLGIIFLGFGVGHRSTDDEIHIRFWEKIPYLIWIGIAMILEAIAVMGLSLITTDAETIGFGNAILFDCEIAMAAILLGEEFVATTLVRIKGKCFWRYTVCHYLAVPFKKLKVQAQTNLPLFWEIVVILSGWSLLELIIVMLSWNSYGRRWQFFWLVIILAVQTAALLVVSMQLVRLYDASKKIAAGEINHPVDTSKLYWKFKEHGENLNHISDAIDAAVQKEMKSEHFQTELITNVSHDIKTPLTSIINYVDLMKQEEITDPKMQDYVAVLDRQSAKLKKLIEDLMEASKASTGNLTVNLEETDAVILLQQAVGEFEERLEKKQLQIMVKSPEPPVTIIADGRHLWRVFDNLLSNICKYALPGSRVYIDLAQDENRTTIIFRNISAAALNISSEELMARFVRGDASRSTEGSGLGLNIAQSLMTLMKGSLKLDVDGDLFKVTLEFPGNS